MSIIFTKHLGKLINEDRIILTNKRNGAWLKISMECYEILENLVESNLSLTEFLEYVEDDVDKIYLRDMVSKLGSIDVLGEVEAINTLDKGSIKKVFLTITDKCNLNCIHCCVDSHMGRNEAPLKDIFNIADKIIELKPDYLSLTGGEPMVRSDFFEIVRYIRKRYRNTLALMTNGTLISENNIKEIVESFDMVDISIDGIDEESCCLIRGEGVFDKVLHSVKLLKNEGLKKISLSMVATEKNNHLIEDFYKLNDRLETKPIVRLFTESGRGKSGNLQLNKRTDGSIVKQMDNAVNGETSNDLKCYSCKAGYKDISIEQDGNIYPCIVMKDDKYLMGNIHLIEDINDFFKRRECNSLILSDKHLISIEPDNFDLCRHCNVNLFCWSCCDNIIDYANNMTDFADRCESKKTILKQFVWNS